MLGSCYSPLFEVLLEIWKNTKKTIFDVYEKYKKFTQVQVVLGPVKAMLRVTIPKIYSKDRKLTSSRNRHRTHACSGATVLIELQATLVCSMLGGLPFTLALGTASGAGVAGGPPGGAPSAAGAGRGGGPHQVAGPPGGCRLRPPPGGAGHDTAPVENQVCSHRTEQRRRSSSLVSEGWAAHCALRGGLASVRRRSSSLLP